jgi:two-component system heavy metal sensor histidine kinase CusS
VLRLSGTSLALRLTLMFALLTAAVVASVGTASYVALSRSLRRAQDQFLNNKVRILVQQLSVEPRDMHAMKEEVEEDFAPRQYAQVYARVFDARHLLVVESPNMSRLLPSFVFPPPIVVDRAPAAEGLEFSAPDGRPFRALAVNATTPAGGGGWIQVALDQRYSEDLLGRHRTHLLIIFASALVLCAASGYAAVRRALRPLRAIAATAQRIGPSPTALAERIDLAGLPRELADVAVRLNRMLDRLEESFGRLSQFSVELAHELRTPLNNLQGLVENSLARPRSDDEYRATLASGMEELQRLTRIIDGLLFIARSDDPRTQIRREEFDLREELRRMVEMYLVLAADQGVRLRFDCERDLRVRLDRTLLQRAVDNLVANAMAHTPAGGEVRIRAARVATDPASIDEGSGAAAGDGGAANAGESPSNGDAGPLIRIEVSDTGSGIAPEDVPHVFERFRRGRSVAPGAASGTASQHQAGCRLGLGLSIVRGIAALHGGHADLASTPGEGTSVWLDLPADG